MRAPQGCVGRVPVLEDGDVSIFESGAIVEYVMARHGDGGRKPAVDAPEFPEYLQWFHYCEGMVMPPVNTIVVQTVLLPPDRRDETALGQAQRLLSKALAPVDEALAGRDSYVVKPAHMSEGEHVFVVTDGKPKFPIMLNGQTSSISMS